MNACEYTAQITAIACLIAKGKSCDEITLLAAFFTQLGDTLATMVTFVDVCCDDKSNDLDDSTLGVVASECSSLNQTVKSNSVAGGNVKINQGVNDDIK